MTTNSKLDAVAEQLFYKPATSTKISPANEKGDGLEVLFEGETQARHYS